MKIDLCCLTNMQNTNTAPTQEEAAAIRRWAKAIQAAEEILHAARPDSVRYEVLEKVGLDAIALNAVRQERRKAQAAVAKLVQTDEENVDALVRWISGDLRGQAPSID